MVNCGPATSDAGRMPTAPWPVRQSLGMVLDAGVIAEVPVRLPEPDAETTAAPRAARGVVPKAISATFAGSRRGAVGDR